MGLGRRVAGSGASRVAKIGAALQLGRRIAAPSVTASEPVRDSANLAPRLIARCAYCVQETFGGVYVDVRSRIISEREIFVGSLTSATAARETCSASPDRITLHP